MRWSVDYKFMGLRLLGGTPHAVSAFTCVSTAAAVYMSFLNINNTDEGRGSLCFKVRKDPVRGAGPPNRVLGP